MVEEKEVIIETSSGDWGDEYKGERPTSDSNWFSDVVQQGEISFTAEITFKSEGERTTNKFNKEVIKFLIDVAGKEKTMEVGTNQYDFLRTLAENKPLIGKTFVHQRTGVGQKDTRRSIKLKQ